MYRNHKQKDGQSNYADIIKAVKNPLGFFVLALLVVETFLAVAFIAGGFSGTIKLVLIGIGVALFMFVVTPVLVLVWKKPQNLTFDQSAYLEVQRGKTEPSLQIVEKG